MEEEEAKILAAARKLPLADRVEHKNWKVRSEAYEDIKKGCDSAFSSDDPILDQAGPLFPKIVGDTNANAMDRALEALCVWLQKANEAQAGRIASGVCSTIASKCLKARAGTVAKATDACLLFTELEQSAPMVESVLKGLSDKVPKVVISALEILYRAVCEFGSKVVDPKPLFKALPSAFAHSNAGVRDKAKELTVELAAGMGPAVVQSTLLEKMSDTMRKDVDSSIAALPAKRKQPERLTRREAAARAAAHSDGVGTVDDGTEDGNSHEMDTLEPMDTDEYSHGADAYEFSDPVDILATLNKAVVVVGDDSIPFWDCFDSKKWNIRKGALDKAKECARAPRLASGDYGNLCRELRKILAKDANINCAAGAAELTKALASGVRGDFSSQARQLCPALLERFKEKNTIMCKSAVEALRTMALYCYTVPDVVDDLAAALTHKNPKVRLDTLRLVADMVEGSEKQHVLKVKDTLIPAVAKLAPDADSSVREAAQSALVACALKLGSFSVIKPFLSKVDDSRCSMIEAAVMAAVKQAPKVPPPAPTMRGAAMPSKAAPAAATTATRTTSGGTVSAKSSSPQALAPKNPNVVARPAAAKPATRSRPAASASARLDDDCVAPLGRISADEAEQRLVQEFGASMVEDLRSPQWQVRLEAITSISDKATANVANPDTAAIILCLTHIPGWTEKNFQVLNRVFEVATTLAKECPGVGKREAVVTVEGACDKIHELKHRLQACEVLTAMSECVGPKFVAAQLHTRAATNKNPKVLSEALSWLAQAVEDFGLAALDLGAILQWMIADLGSPSAPVRNQAMAVLGRCHAQVGGGLMAQLEQSLKPAQVTALEEIFKKNPQDPGYQPTRKPVRAGGGATTTVTHGGGTIETGFVGEAMESDGEGLGTSSLEDLLPRADVSGKFTPTLISRIGHSNWKERNAALEEVEVILKEAGGRILPDVPSDLFAALRGRMADTNRNLAARALLLIAKLADAIGSPFDRMARPVLAPALGTLSDNKKQVRDAAIVLLDSWMTTCSPDRLFPAVADAVGNPKGNIDGRLAALSWMTLAVEEGRVKSDMQKCAESALKAVAVAIADKAVGIRDAGGKLLGALVQVLGGEEVGRALHGLDAPTRKVAEPMVQKVIQSVAAAGSVSTTSAPLAESNHKAAAPGSKPRSAATAVGSTPVAVPSTSRPPPIRAMDDSPLPILIMATGKAARCRQFRIRPGRFEGPPPDELDTLDTALTPVASEEFHALLFSRDFKSHLKAVDALVEALPTLLPEITSTLDLLLRWAVVRVCEGNTQVLVSVLEVLKALLDELASTGYRLLDSEAAALLPAIVEKAGHNQDRVRGLHREVLHVACHVYPAHRVLDFVTQGLVSKNNRTRVECCEEIVSLVEREGAGPVISCKAKPMTALAALLKERDGTLRAAVLSAIESVWAEEGSEVMWKLLGPLDPREKGMVEDRIKRSTKQSLTVRGAPAAAHAAAVPAGFDDSATPGTRGAFVAGPSGDFHEKGGLDRNPRPGNGRDGVELAYSRPAFTPPNALDMTPVAERPQSAAYEEPVAADSRRQTGDFVPKIGSLPQQGATAMATPIPRPMALTPTHPVGASTTATIHDSEDADGNVAIPLTGPDDAAFERRWAAHLADMASPSLPDAINATKLLCADIMQVSAAADPQAPPVSQYIRATMGASAERLFLTVLDQLDAIFAAAQAEGSAGVLASSRGCKFALNALLQGMCVREIATGLPQAALRETVSLLLCRLVDDRGLMLFDEGPTLVRAVNVLIAKMLEASDRNLAFAALLQLLREPPAGLDPELVPKFNDLVVKCLIKLTKALAGGQQSTGGGAEQSSSWVDMPRLLFNLHDFFMFLGVDEIRKRSSSDKPLRMVKTILYEVCKLEGRAIYDAAAGIPGRHSNPPGIIFTYIQLNLKTLEQAGKLKSAASGAGDSDECGAGNSEIPNYNGEHEGACLDAATSAADVRIQAAKAEVKQRLKEIMTRLVSKDATQQEAAMVELYRLKKEQPQYVERYVAKTSAMFKQFIDDGFSRLEATTPVGRSPGGGVLPRVTNVVDGDVGSAAFAVVDSPSPGSALPVEMSQSRLSTLRERLTHIRASTDAGTPGGEVKGLSAGSSSENLPALSQQGHGQQHQRSGHPSVEELAARLQMLRHPKQ